MGGGRSADGGDGGSVCVDEEEKVVCALAGEGREVEETTGNPLGGCWDHLESVVRGL